MSKTQLVDSFLFRLTPMTLLVNKYQYVLITYFKHFDLFSENLFFYNNYLMNIPTKLLDIYISLT
jgi:hypothetical protein